MAPPKATKQLVRTETLGERQREVVRLQGEFDRLRRDGQFGHLQPDGRLLPQTTAAGRTAAMRVLRERCTAGLHRRYPDDRGPAGDRLAGRQAGGRARRLG